MPSATARSWKMFLPLGGVVLLGLLWTGYWFVASAIAKDRVAQERAALAAIGLELACAEEGWGGYPFHFEFSCTSPRLTLEDKGEAKSGKLLLVALGQLIAGAAFGHASGLQLLQQSVGGSFEFSRKIGNGIQ